MATFEPDVCTIDVMAGTDMEVTITYEDGGTSQSTNFSIAGNWDIIGPPLLTDKAPEKQMANFTSAKF